MIVLTVVISLHTVEAPVWSTNAPNNNHTVEEVFCSIPCSTTVYATGSYVPANNGFRRA